MFGGGMLNGIGPAGAMPPAGWMPFVGFTVLAGWTPVGEKVGAGSFFGVFQAEAFVGVLTFGVVATAVGFGLARDGNNEFGRVAAMPVGELVLAQPVMLAATITPAHIPAVRLDIARSPSRHGTTDAHPARVGPAAPVSGLQAAGH
jgi:hypothetical protein